MLAAACALTALIFSRLMFDVFNTPKLIVVVSAALALVGIGLVAASRRHRVLAPRSAAAAAAVTFGGIAAIATLLSPSPERSLAGASGARAGLALYLACIVLFAAAARLSDDGTAAAVVKSVLAAAVPVVAYGAAQAFGLDPLGWRSTAGGPPVFSTMGNANFFSAWCGIVAVLAAWGALSQSWSAAYSAASAVLFVATLWVALLSQSIQGPIAAVLGLSVLAAARLSDRRGHSRRLRTRSVVPRALPVLVAVVGGLVVTTRGDAVGSIASRIGKWQAALAMGRARPLTGFGLDLFGDWYHQYRPVFDAVERGLGHTAEAAHSVPLQLLAGGGFPLLAAYAWFVIAVAWLALRALRQSTGERRLLVGALAGAWLAYQVQSVVSMDVPALAVLHWVLAGLLVAAATPAPRTDTEDHRHPRWRPGTALAVTLVAGLVLLGLTIPVRADVAARRAIRLAAQDEHASAEKAFSIALRLNPWEPRYPLAMARARAERGDEQLAADAYALAAGRNPRSMPIAFEAARAAASAGDDEQAAERYADALRLDPKSPELLGEVARFHLDRGRRELAVSLLQRAVELDPSPRWQRRLERARD